MPDPALDDDMLDDDDTDQLESRVTVFRTAASRAANAPPPPRPPVKRMRLSTPEEISAQMKRVFRQASNGEISAMEGKRLSAILRDLLDVHSSTQTQTRLDTIERLLSRLGKMR